MLYLIIIVNFYTMSLSEKNLTSVKDGLEAAGLWVREIFNEAKSSKNIEIMDVCSKVEDVNSKFIYPAESKLKIEGTPPKNHAQRFSTQDSYSFSKKTAWGFKPSRKSIFGISTDSQDYEDVIIF